MGGHTCPVCPRLCNPGVDSYGAQEPSILCPWFQNVFSWLYSYDVWEKAWVQDVFCVAYCGILGFLQSSLWHDSATPKSCVVAGGVGLGYTLLLVVSEQNL